MTFQIRLATQGDIPQIDSLYRRSYPRLLKADYAPSIIVTVVPMFSISQPKLVTSGRFYVAEHDDGQIIGAGGWSRLGPRGEVIPSCGHIRHFATDPDTTRLGVGKGLMYSCIVQALSEDMARFSCYSTLTAVPFYEAMGFTRKGDIMIEFANSMQFPSVLMERDLP